ncbi:uncharacterized protein [Rutidosis leptorrhynchoides]|uniref:uncharacterized protein n=1 Tax=Rutidosis leptorrhynchoides TaxID=125765 RepID=UPI003A994B91
MEKDDAVTGRELAEADLTKLRTALPTIAQKLVLGHLFSAQSNIDPSHSYGHLRSCSPVLGAGRPRGVRGGCRVATVGRIRVGSWNIGTLTGKRIELVDTFLKSKVDIVCVQETRWKGEEAIEIQDYKLWYSGSRIARNGVGIFLGKLHKDNVVDVGRFSDRIMSVSLINKEETFTVISAYAPHAGLGDAEKKSFWESLDEVVRGCPADHRLIIGGDLNGHIGVEAEGYEGAHGGFGFGPRNEEGRSILEFAIAHELVVVNSFFKKRDAQLATFHSGGRSTQIDFLLLRKGELRTCRDCKVLPALTCSSQHRLLVMDLVTRGRVGRRARAVQPRILWKNLYGANAETFRAIVVNRLSVEEDYVAPTDADQIWNRMVSTIRDVAKETLGVAIGTSRAHKSRRESWWLSDDVQSKVALKQTRIAKARERGRRDLGNIKYIKDVAGQSIVREDLIRKRWEEYFASLFGRGRPEQNGEPHEVQEFQNNCFCTRINQEEVRLALRKMGRNKAVGPDQIPIEAWKCLGGDGALLTKKLQPSRPVISFCTFAVIEVLGSFDVIDTDVVKRILPYVVASWIQRQYGQSSVGIYRSWSWNLEGVSDCICQYLRSHGVAELEMNMLKMGQMELIIMGLKFHGDLESS